MGDGIKALFGAFLAFQDHAVRACYASRSMGDGPATPYVWNPPTQVKVKTRTEEGVLVRLVEIGT